MSIGYEPIKHGVLKNGVIIEMWTFITVNFMYSIRKFCLVSNVTVRRSAVRLPRAGRHATSRHDNGHGWPQAMCGRRPSRRGDVCVGGWVGLPRAAVQVKTTGSTLGNLASMEGRSSTQGATALFFLLPRCTAAATS